MSSPAERLRQRISADGPIPFAEFMDEALYGEGGYYARRNLPIGADGDFVTGASMSPLFGRATARVVRLLDEVIGSPADFLEVGYGSGRHLESVAESLPEKVERRLLACDRIVRPVPPGVEAVGELSILGRRSLSGLIFSYELFDALPVHRLIGLGGGRLGELWVGLGPAGDFRYAQGELSEPSLADLLGEGVTLATGQVADLAPGWRPLYGRLAGLLERGLLVTCDYGFERERLLDPRVRFHGTLACHHRQRVHRNALSGVGEQDLTAHVDLTALREEGERHGLHSLALTCQARWLTACGIFDRLQRADQATRLEAMDLLRPGGMGEEIKVLIQGRGIDVRDLFDPEVLGTRGTSGSVS